LRCASLVVSRGRSFIPHQGSQRSCQHCKETGLPARETRPLVIDLPCLSWTAGTKEPFVKFTGTFARVVHGPTYLVYQQPNLQRISCSGPSVTSTVCVGSITSGVSNKRLPSEILLRTSSVLVFRRDKSTASPLDELGLYRVSQERDPPRRVR